MEHDFSHLSKFFTKWHDEVFDYYGKHLIEPENDGFIDDLLHEERDFVRQIGLTESQFEKSFLTPYLRLSNKKELSLGTLKKISDIQSKAIGHRQEVLFNGETPLMFKVEPSSSNYLNALNWTVVNVQELSLPGFTFIDGRYDIQTENPFLQCRFCGRKATDERGRHFNKKLRYCHVKGCRGKSTDPNPDEHKKCCYGQWGLIKKTFRQKLFRNKNYQTETKILFKMFCQNRLEGNLKIQTRVQIEPYV